MLKPQFFPKDLSYLSYVDVWLPPDAPLGATDTVTQRAETVIRQESERFGNEHHQKDVLKSLTTFVGGGGPRFWFSVDPERQQLNYAQILVEVSDKHFTNELRWAAADGAEPRSPGRPGRCAAARDRQAGWHSRLHSNFRSRDGSSAPSLWRSPGIFRAQPNATRVRDDWGEPAMNVRLKVDPDRANLSGITNLDIALSSAAAESGLPSQLTGKLTNKSPSPFVCGWRTVPDYLTFKMRTSTLCPAISAYL
jgi:multidrug efflux pump